MKSWLLVVGLAVAGALHAAQGPNVEYSANAYFETAAAVMEGPAYFAPGKERREYLMEGVQSVNITRRDKNVIWMLMPEDKMYMEMKPNEDNSQSDLSGYQIEQTPIGPEVVNGVQTNKSKIIMTAPTGEKMGGFMWVTQEGIVVKMDAIAMDKKSKLRFKTELKDLQIGDVDDSLFEIPADYTKMDIMGGIGKAMFGDGDDGTGGDAGQADADQPPPKEKKKGFGWKDAIDMVR
jgi:outer membrane lipoprotein-sorting protein